VQKASFSIDGQSKLASECQQIASPGITDISLPTITVPVKMNLTIPFSSKETAKDPQFSTVIISHLVKFYHSGYSSVQW